MLYSMDVKSLLFKLCDGLPDSQVRQFPEFAFAIGWQQDSQCKRSFAGQRPGAEIGFVIQLLHDLQNPFFHCCRYLSAIVNHAVDGPDGAACLFGNVFDSDMVPVFPCHFSCLLFFSED